MFFELISKHFITTGSGVPAQHSGDVLDRLFDNLTDNS